MPGHTQFQETFDVHLQAKNQLHLSCSPWDVARILQYVILSTLGMSGYAHPKWSMNWQKTFVFICRHKINLILLVFLEIFQRHTHSKRQYEVNFIIHFFLEMLHSKEFCNFIGLSILAHNLRTRILLDIGLVVNINNNIKLHFRLFPWKTNNTISKNPKNFISGPFWTLFALIRTKMNFPGKKGSISF